jgi:hypothetical protein
MNQRARINQGSNLVGQCYDGWMVKLTSHEGGICLYNNRMLSAIRDNNSLLAERLNLSILIVCRELTCANSRR